MGRPAGWLKGLTGRNSMISPGAPKRRRSVERQFWKEVATGASSEDAGAAVGVSQAVGARWFRQGGGMTTITLVEPGGRYLSFVEREEIALLRTQNVGVREMARRLGRDASTVSRELRRNAATRAGKLHYRASVAQWKSELMARRPKTAKLVKNPRLRPMFRSISMVVCVYQTVPWLPGRRSRRGRAGTSPIVGTGPGRSRGVRNRSRNG